MDGVFTNERSTSERVEEIRMVMTKQKEENGKTSTGTSKKMPCHT